VVEDTQTFSGSARPARRTFVKQAYVSTYNAPQEFVILGLIDQFEQIVHGSFVLASATRQPTA